MTTPRVRIHLPPGARSTQGIGGTWELAKDADGNVPFTEDLRRFRKALPDHMSSLRVEHIRELMHKAQQGNLPGDLVEQIACAPDVLEIRLGKWMYTGGEMHTRLYFSEPHDVPGMLVALRLRFKRPGPLGLEQQNQHAYEASDLLLAYKERGYDV